MTTKLKIDNLPDDCLVMISRCLGRNDFVALSRLNKSIRNAIASNQTAWFYQYQNWTRRYDREQHKKVNYRRRLAHLLKKHLEKKYDDLNQRVFQGMVLNANNRLAVLTTDIDHFTERRKRAQLTIEHIDAQLARKGLQMAEWNERREHAKRQLWKGSPFVNPLEHVKNAFAQFEPRPRANKRKRDETAATLPPMKSMT
jgi:hypothetical protein